MRHPYDDTCAGSSTSRPVSPTPTASTSRRARDAGPGLTARPAGRGARRRRAAHRRIDRRHVEAGWAAPRPAPSPSPGGRPPPAALDPPRWRPAALRSPVVAGVAVVAILAGAGAAAAADWLPIFHTERVAPITIVPRPTSPQLPDLAAYGKIEITKEPHVRVRWAVPKPRAERHRSARPAGARVAARP